MANTETKTEQKGKRNTDINQFLWKGGMCMYHNIPEIMTFRECCELLKVGKNTMLTLLHTKQIEGFRIGNRWRIPKESVVEFVERR